MTKPKSLFSKQKARQLANELREIAAKWEQGPRGVLFRSGICLALRIHRGGGKEYSAYEDMTRLLNEAQDSRHFLGTYLCVDTESRYETCWSARATMCLLLAEWLESEVFA